MNSDPPCVKPVDTSPEQNDPPPSLEEQPLTYEYQRLEPGGIRVLDLLSGPGEQLRCRLRTVQFRHSTASTGDDLPSYVALSYVWGPASKPFALQIVDEDGQSLGRVPLTASLQSALQDLRGCVDIRTKTFWIDQICINQRDKAEKNDQVARMKKIYECASQVVTYLGPEEPGDEEAIVLLQSVYRWYTDKTTGHLLDGESQEVCNRLRGYCSNPSNYYLHYKKGDDVPSALRFAFGSEDEDGAAYRHLDQAIISTAWTKRLWVVQENVVNPSAGFLRGPRHIEWDCVGTVAALSLVGILPYFSRSLFVCSLHELRVLRPASITKRDSLYALMSDLSISGLCSDVRDKIYALLGLAGDAEELQILPEYEKCPAQVYTDLAVRYVEKFRAKGSGCGLEVLEYVSRQRSPDPLLPTWVPAFTDLRWSHSGRGHRLPDESISFDSTASVRNAILVARGLRLTPLAEQLGSFRTSLDSLTSAAELRRVAATLDRAAERDCAAVCHVLMMDPVWPRDAAQDPAGVFHDVRRVLDLAGQGFLRVPHGKYRELFFLPRTHPDVSVLAAYVIECSVAMVGRALWVAGDGGLVLAPSGAREGDVPVLLFGGRWAYFLRPCAGDVFEYLGWGYVHGAMCGEALRAEGWEERVERFRIK